ncbi:MAG: hypothetical protein ACTSVR_03195 [Candidatus Thorarchaeota archaeon]
MIHNIQWICKLCDSDVWIEDGFSPGKCPSCGHTMVQGCGEEYDQEFVDEEKYQRAKEEFNDRWRR